jgi:hypothetical protein
MHLCVHHDIVTLYPLPIHVRAEECISSYLKERLEKKGKKNLHVRIPTRSRRSVTPCRRKQYPVSGFGELKVEKFWWPKNALPIVDFISHACIFAFRSVCPPSVQSKFVIVSSQP